MQWVDRERERERERERCVASDSWVVVARCAVSAWSAVWSQAKPYKDTGRTWSSPASPAQPVTSQRPQSGLTIPGSPGQASLCFTKMQSE